MWHGNAIAQQDEVGWLLAANTGCRVTVQRLLAPAASQICCCIMLVVRAQRYADHWRSVGPAVAVALRHSIHIILWFTCQ
jgi:hypothetical protein